MKRIQSQISVLQESLNSETRSSAGDKHETGRAMLQLEREKLGQQLLEVEKQQRALSAVSVKKRSTNVCLGSLVYATTANYFLAVSVGEFIKDGSRVYCISPQTPIGRQLIGKTKGDSILFKNTTFNILEVL
jgi:transcription elongation GreA/GreB family factor